MLHAAHAGLAGELQRLAPEGIDEYEAGGAHDLLSPPGPHSVLDARLGAQSPRYPHVPRRESPPAGQKTPDSGHVSQEPKSENSSTQSSPEMPTTKNRLGLRAHWARSSGVVGSSFPSPWGLGLPTALALPRRGIGEAWALSQVLF